MWLLCLFCRIFLHHYEEFMDVGGFHQAAENVNSLIQEYRESDSGHQQAGMADAQYHGDYSIQSALDVSSGRTGGRKGLKFL
jgi:hypothetical protein